jgi:catechol 2,3-dioxygenase-like lactoylglutathione lyase family enzyme
VAERFYVEVLGEVFGHSSLDTRYMLSTDELLEAGRRGAARTRTDGAADVWVARPPHSNLTLGEAKISLYLAPFHIQEPPPEQLRGAPRLALSATPEQIERAAGVLTRQGIPFEGPVVQPPPCPVTQSIYFRDPAGNFLELCCIR